MSKHTSALALKIIYPAFCTWLWVTELYFCETLHIVPQFLACKNKRQLKLWKGVGIEFQVETLFKKWKILPLTSQYLLY